MKKISILLAILTAIATFAACNGNDTYAEQIERERNSVNEYIVKHGIKVISEDQFERQNFSTDITKNEFVRFNNTGVYMQILHEGIGEKLRKGETATVLCRFDEFNVMEDSLQLTNRSLHWSGIVDKMSVTNTSGTFTASFDTSSSLMFRTYKSASVPPGWLAPLAYIKIGRIKNATDSLAHVRIIVPSTQGHQNASQNVYACFYDITYGRGL